MTHSAPSPGADPLQAGLAEFEQKLADLPAGYRDPLVAEFARLRAALAARVAAQDAAGKAAAADLARAQAALAAGQVAWSDLVERVAWLARFPDENPNPVARVAMDGAVLYRNRASAEPGCWALEAGKPLPPAFAPLLAEAIRGEGPFQRDLALGEKVYSLTLMPFPGEGYVNLYGLDITDRRRAETALRESQDRFRVALNAVPIFVYTCDRDLRYTWVYQVLRGYRAEDVLGRRDDEILSPEAAAELVAAKQRALEAGQGLVQEVRVPLGGEETFYVLTSDPIRDAQGEVSGLTCSAIDITGYRRLEIERQEQAIQIEVQRRLLDQREQDRYAMARNLHDGPIQTLSSTMFQLHMIGEVFADPDLQGELGKIGVDIRDTIRDLRQVMNDLRPPALVHFGLARVIREYSSDLRGRFPELEMAVDIAADDSALPGEVQLNLFRIFQAGVNNIVRHSGASKAWVVLRIEPGGYRLEIGDNGRGFAYPPDLSGLTRAGHFGLVGMRERAEAIGARLSVESAPGQGTVVVVEGVVDH